MLFPSLLSIDSLRLYHILLEYTNGIYYYEYTDGIFLKTEIWRGHMGKTGICKNVNVISDENGKSLVLINDVRFRTRRTIDWNRVEEYLKEYIGNHYEILETSEKVYIGVDFPDEFCHSQDKINLKGANEKAKAKYGWYRYDTRFGLPLYDSEGELERYDIYTARMLVRCDKDGRLYLYDLVRTKKETSSPSEQQCVTR